MAKKKLPAALKAHQFKSGSKKSKKAGGKGGRKSTTKGYKKKK
jgi:hypothetical protein